MPDNYLGKKNGANFEKYRIKRLQVNVCKWEHLLEGDNVRVVKGERQCMMCRMIRCAHQINERRKVREGYVLPGAALKKKTPEFYYTANFKPRIKTGQETEREEFMRLYGDKKKRPRQDI